MWKNKNKIYQPLSKRQKWERTHSWKLRNRAFRMAYWKLLATGLIMGGATCAYLLLLDLPGHIYASEAQKQQLGAEFAATRAYKALSGTKMEPGRVAIVRSAEFYGLPLEIYVGIANAESSLNNFKDGCYNPWGIGNNGPTCFDSWEQGANEFGRLLKYYYFAEGKITPEQLLNKYVGWNNPHWVNNVKKYYDPKINYVLN